MENKIKQLQKNFRDISVRTQLYCNLQHNKKFLLNHNQELEEDILILMNEIQTKKVILQINKLRQKIEFNNLQINFTNKQINGEFN